MGTPNIMSTTALLMDRINSAHEGTGNGGIGDAVMHYVGPT